MGEFLLIVVLVLILVFFVELIAGAISKPSERPAQRKASGAAGPSKDRGERVTIDVRYGGVTWQPPPSPEEAARQSHSCWRGATESVTVAGRDIPRGMLYVGKELQSLERGTPDPTLINPSLEAVPPEPAAGKAEGGLHIGYFPSYSQISPRARGAYLDWLAGGRSAPGVDQGLIFLFFYGLERRALFDAEHAPVARHEIPAIIAELERLLGLYGHHDSFRGYASSLRDYLQAGVGFSGLPPSDPVFVRDNWRMPLSNRRELAKIVASGERLPAPWAAAWYMTHPNTRLRTPGTRCPEEYIELFQLRYRDRWGDGMKVPAPKRLWKVQHGPATGSFRRTFAVETGLPDLDALSAPLRKLEKVSAAVEAELTPYSRHLGRTEDRTSIAAVSLLPPALRVTRMGKDAVVLKDWIESVMGDKQMALTPSDRLVQLWPSKADDKLSKREASALADFLEGMEIGVEPDMRHGGPNPTRASNLVLFRTNGSRFEPSPEYQGATVLMSLAVSVALADDDVNEATGRHMEAHLEEGLAVSDQERLRLRAHLLWLLDSPPSNAFLRKKLEGTAAQDRSRIGRFLLSLAGADGYVSPEEIKVLTRIYPILGLDPDELFSDLHSLVLAPDAGRRPDHEGEPVTVIRGDPTNRDIPIPAPPNPAGGAVLDLERIRRIRADTREVSELLGKVFGESQGPEEGPEDAASEVDGEIDAADKTLRGLDLPHSRFVGALSTRSEWSWAEFEMMAGEFGLMPSGSIETLNDAAFSACDEPLLEGEDPLQVNSHALEILSA